MGHGAGGVLREGWRHFKPALTLAPLRSDRLTPPPLLPQVVNLWRPIAPSTQPCRSLPLCLCDASTVRPDDFVDYDVVGQFGVTTMKYSEQQRWWFYPDMMPDEVRWLGTTPPHPHTHPHPHAHPQLFHHPIHSLIHSRYTPATTPAH